MDRILLTAPIKGAPVFQYPDFDVAEGVDHVINSKAGIYMIWFDGLPPVLYGYVGETIDFEARCRDYNSKYNNGTLAGQRKLYNTLRAHEAHQAYMTPIHINLVDRDTRKNAEIVHIAVQGTFENGLNLTKGGDSNPMESEEVRAHHKQRMCEHTAPTARSTSGYRGVHFHKAHGSWTANITFDGRTIHLGCFDTAEEAHAAYETAWQQRRDGTFVPPKPVHSSTHKGVSFAKRVNKWSARPTVNGVRKFLGYFLTEEEAVAAIRAFLAQSD